MLLAKASPATRELFGELRERIRLLDEAIVEKPKAIYVAYRLSNTFAEIYVNKSGLKVLLRPIEYVDPEHRVVRIPETYHWTLDRRVDVRTPGDIDGVMQLVEQSYQSVL
jgi:predicted transport protein